MDRRELVEKMLKAFYGSYPFEPATVLSEINKEYMDKALSVAIDELLKEPAFEEKKQVATDYFDNHAHYALEAFIASRRAKLETVKTVEERVTVVLGSGGIEVIVDGKTKYGFEMYERELAGVVRLGLIQQLKEKN